MKPLIQELPEHYQVSSQDAELQRVLTLLAEDAEAALDFTLDQLFPSTASGWGLALWEDGLRHPPGGGADRGPAPGEGAGEGQRHRCQHAG